MSVPVPERVLVVGSGSIAQRHVRNLLALGVGEVVVVTARDVSDVEAFADPRLRVEPVIPADCPHAAIVANDTDRHVATARALVDRGAHVLVEKPIGTGPSAELSALQDEAAHAGVVVRVAYNLRLLGVMRLLRDLLDAGEIGRALFAHIEVGQWLPDWRSGRRVAEGYSASLERGGGVALDLSHEVDYMFMLFGMPAEWRISTANTGILGIAAPEVFDGSYVFADGFSCTTHMDYLERPARRRIRVVGAEGTIECDLIGGALTVARGADSRVYDDPALFDTQGSYVAELEEFFALAGGSADAGHLPTLDEAERVLELLADRKAE